MLLKEYRICMPLTVEEYQIGQLYTINKHSHQESNTGEGVEVLRNEPHRDPKHGQGCFTEKRLHLASKLPSWVRAFVPRIFYITEKGRNYYPYTVTEYTDLPPIRHRGNIPAPNQLSPDEALNVFTFYFMRFTWKLLSTVLKEFSECSFLPKFSVHIETKYEDNCGTNENVFSVEKEKYEVEVDFIDIAHDDIPERHYKVSEDLKRFSSVKTGRGPLEAGWRKNSKPVMCSYKLVHVQFEVFGLQSRVEQYIQKVIRDVLLVGHRQAFAWVDEWYSMTLDDVRSFESQMQIATNQKFRCQEK